MAGRSISGEALHTKLDGNSQGALKATLTMRSKGISTGLAKRINTIGGEFLRILQGAMNVGVKIRVLEGQKKAKGRRK
jgi:hypothetical protein